MRSGPSRSGRPVALKRRDPKTATVSTAVVPSLRGPRHRQVRERVARRREHPHLHRRGDVDDVSVANSVALERDRVLGVDVVLRAGQLGESVPPGDVVVVDVGLEDVLDLDALRPGEIEHPVDVALRVDDDRHGPVMG